MSDTEAREKIVEATQALLAEGVSADDITVRRIAARAGVGIGTVSYHFHSKEKLVYEAIGRQMAALAGPRSDGAAEPDPRRRLRRFLLESTELALLHAELFRAQLSYQIVHGDMSICYTIAPMLREILGPGRSDLELKLVALEIVSAMQMIYLKAEEFLRYAGVDVRDPKQREEALDALLNTVLE
jgi:AcrR family transcriptional regulator